MGTAFEGGEEKKRGGACMGFSVPLVPWFARKQISFYVLRIVICSCSTTPLCGKEKPSGSVHMDRLGTIEMLESV